MNKLKHQMYIITWKKLFILFNYIKRMDVFFYEKSYLSIF